MLTQRNYLSHSSLSTYLGCGERFRLERVVGVPQSKAWYLIGGSAFHTASEMLDKGEQDDPTLAWALAWDKHYEQEITANGVHVDDVRAAGRKSDEWPNKEDSGWWQYHGPQFLRDYVEWRDGVFTQGWQWFLLPNGEPAIELPINLELGGTLVKGFIDRVMVNDNGEAVVVDLKTGSHSPASSLQLGIYALGVQHHLGVQPTLGGYYMARKKHLTGPVSLLHYTPDLVGRWFDQARAGIEQELFIPNVSFMCMTCSVRPYCTAFPQPLVFSPTNATSS